MNVGGFLGRALASRESAYFLQQSKNAVGNLIVNNNKEKIRGSGNSNNSSSGSKGADDSDKVGDLGADVLPEVLRHSIPITPTSYASSSSLSSASKWALNNHDSSPRRSDSAVLNPLRDYVSLPQVTFGPNRWSLPDAQETSGMASTANELRVDRHTHVNPQNLKAAAEGLALVGKAFAVATIMVFGGATFVFAMTVSQLQLQTTDDIKAKGRDILQPKVEVFREKMVPLRNQVDRISRKWQIEGKEDIKERPVIKELSKLFRAGIPK